ncbi:hypothetical protein [Aquaticitalea lipolytica]|uniref:hypothetical protein n=1 Tax=Aquaticitalea lipolytica TaxID=1247562 RepID=UPI0016663EA8|nr:hypothetical protein [Aquaticitalea lipolytica]
MRKFLYVFVALLLGANFVSCTPTSITENSDVPQACCGEEGEILPPPPPPPPPLPIGG